MKLESMAGATTDSGNGFSEFPFREGYFSPGSLPVLLRIPRLTQETPSPVADSVRAPRNRWKVGLGAAALMLIVSLPWLIRWRPSPGYPTITGTPVLTVEDDVESLPTPPMTTRAAASLAFEPDSGLPRDNFTDQVRSESESVEFWLNPSPSRGTP
jgi:hypothetical protein